MIYQNLRLDMYIISFHCIICIWGHLDTQNAVRRRLRELNCRSVSSSCTFVIFAIFNSCMICLCPFGMYCEAFCLLSRGATYAFLGCVCCLVQAYEERYLRTQISGTWWFSLSLGYFSSWCYMSSLFPSDPCLFWGWSVREFWYLCHALSIHVFVGICGVL